MDIRKMISKRISQKTKERFNKIIEYGWHIVLFAVVVLGFALSARPVVSLVSTWLKISALNKEKALYLESIRRDSMLIENLKNDEFLERYAREKYFMQGKGEQVFIVE